MDRRTCELIAKLAPVKAEATAPAREVLEHLYKVILAMPEFLLKDGTKARLDPYIEPGVGKRGELHCGFDVLLDNGSHLEFTVTNTGWGKSLASGRDRTGPANGRER